MLSSKLIASIEDHSERITARVLREVREDPKLLHLRTFPESEVRERAQDILKHLGHWLAASHANILAATFETLGHRRYSDGIPLHECVRGYQIIKVAMLDFVRDEGFSKTPVDLYAEEELEHGVGQFFDALTYYVVRGYEEAANQAAHPVARAARM